MNKLFLLLVLILIILPWNTEATLIDDLRQKIEEKNQELKLIEEEIRKYELEIETTGKETTTLKTTLKELDTARKKLLADIRAIENRISATNTNIQKLSLEIKDKESRLQKSLAGMEKSLRNIDEAESNDFVEILLSGQSFSDVWEDIDNLESLNKNLQAHIDEVRVIKEALEGDKVKKEKERLSLLGLKSSLSDRKVIVENNTAEKNRVLKETQNKESTYKKLLEEQLRKKNALEAELFEFESKLRVEIDPNSLPKVGTGVLSWPLDSVTITQYFGNTPFASKNPQVYNQKGHNGIDLRAPLGTQIKASLAGVVVDTGNTDTACYGVSYGKWVLIEHANGLSTLYAHLDLIKVSAGEGVGVGQVIGYSGNTGYSTGPHLHFAVFASQAVHVSGPTEYRSRVCGTYLKLPVAPTNGYLNPLSYL